jgi:hypothetical protein
MLEIINTSIESPINKSADLGISSANKCNKETKEMKHEKRLIVIAGDGTSYTIFNLISVHHILAKNQYNRLCNVVLYSRIIL